MLNAIFQFLICTEMLIVSYLLGYPLEWIITKTYIPLANYLLAKRAKWDAAYRD